MKNPKETAIKNIREGFAALGSDLSEYPDEEIERSVKRLIEMGGLKAISSASTLTPKMDPSSF